MSLHTRSFEAGARHSQETETGNGRIETISRDVHDGDTLSTGRARFHHAFGRDAGTGKTAGSP
jgi:hypothetical protein